jgi:hypothetical protein
MRVFIGGDMRQMKETAPKCWVVWDEPLPMGKTASSGVGVYEWSAGNWSCDECGTVGGFPPAGSTVPHCDHIQFVQTQRRR